MPIYEMRGVGVGDVSMGKKKNGFVAVIYISYLGSVSRARCLKMLDPNDLPSFKEAGHACLDLRSLKYYNECNEGAGYRICRGQGHGKQFVLIPATYNIPYPAERRVHRPALGSAWLCLGHKAHVSLER